MKKQTLVIAFFLLSITVGFAQQKAFEPMGFWDNWFIQAQGGASYTISEYHKDASFSDVIAPHAALSVGKYFSPKVGARLQLGGWQSKNYFALNKTEGTYKVKYFQASADALFNLTNIFLPYNEDRVFNLIGFAGIGVNHVFKDADRKLGRRNSIVPRVGIQADFRMSEAISLNLELAGNLYSDNFNGNVYGKKYDATVNALAGITYRFPQRTFKTVEPEDPSLSSALNNKINELRSSLANKDSEISKLRDDLAKKVEPTKVIVKETKEVREDTEILMNAVVVFRIGKAVLEQNQDINIFNAARYLKDNPQMKVTVTGYADKSTGNATINQRLSEQRAEAVAKVLIDKYGISPSRITTKASGDKEQLFPTDAWNRVVVFTATRM